MGNRRPVKRELLIEFGEKIKIWREGRNITVRYGESDPIYYTEFIPALNALLRISITRKLSEASSKKYKDVIKAIQSLENSVVDAVERSLKDVTIEEKRALKRELRERKENS